MRNQRESGLQDKCLRCGECCEKGGPALHVQDKALLETGGLKKGDLITLRKGEFAHNPLKDEILPIGSELVKIKGQGNTWCCLFYDKTSRGCKIYENRAYGCGVLKCWDPGESLKIIGKDTLSRLDIIEESDPLRETVVFHEEKCPVPDLTRFKPGEPPGNTMLIYLEKLVKKDLDIRNEVLRKFDLSLAEELFYFGRPVFQILQPFGGLVKQTAAGISFSWR